MRACVRVMAESVSGIQKNPINRLQEIFQQWKIPLPTYREGGGSYSQFGTEVTIVIEGTTQTFSGLGRTKKVSKTNAAQEALDYIIKNLPHLLEPPPLPECLDNEAAGAEVGVWRKGDKLNQQHTPSVDQNTLARETEQLAHVEVGLEMGWLVQQNRLKQGLSQKDLAVRINEKVSVVSEYESGRAIPNQQIIAKMERVLGVHLRGERAGQPKIMGRGKRY